MRDVFIEHIYQRMRADRNIFFLSADFGSPKLDVIRKDFKDRFINVGIAEQNLINVAAGLALEGFDVFAYAIAPFLTMRAYEQIRINLALQGQLKKINVNLIAVGAGLSYDVSGPTHHCLEDLSIMRALPNLVIFSPSDWVLARKFVDYSLSLKQPKYLRFEGKSLPRIYAEPNKIKIEDGFCELRKGGKLCVVSTGFMTHKALKIADRLKTEGVSIGVIDLFLMRPLNEEGLFRHLKKYSHVLSLSEEFIHKGGMDSLLLTLLSKKRANITFEAMGFEDAYSFDIGSREDLHRLRGLDEGSIINLILGMIRKNTKSEIRNPKQIRNPNFQMLKTR